MYCTTHRPCLGEFGYACTSVNICRGGILFSPYERCLLRLDDYLRGTTEWGLGPFTAREWFDACEVRSSTINERRTHGHLHDDLTNRELALQELLRIEGWRITHEPGCDAPRECIDVGRCQYAKDNDDAMDVTGDAGMYCLDGSVSDSTNATPVWSMCGIAFGTASDGVDDRVCLQCGVWHKTRDQFIDCMRAMMMWYLGKLEQNGRLVNV